MCHLRNIAMQYYQENVTTGHTLTDGLTDSGQSDPYERLCFAGDTKIQVNSVTPFITLHNDNFTVAP